MPPLPCDSRRNAARVPSRASVTERATSLAAASSSMSSSATSA